MKIYDLLPYGQENAISMYQLQKITGIESERALRSKIREERLKGAVILSTKSNGGGYFRPETAEELFVFIRTYDNEAKAIKSMLRTARKALRGAENEQ